MSRDILRRTVTRTRAAGIHEDNPHPVDEKRRAAVMRVGPQRVPPYRGPLPDVDRRVQDQREGGRTARCSWARVLGRS
jgi:hypothetical protein